MNEKKLENAVLALCELYDEAHKAQNWESMERIEEAIDALFCSVGRGSLELARFYAKKGNEARELAEMHYTTYVETVDDEAKDTDEYKEAVKFMN